MSFIQSTLRCRHCGEECNIALGTFGFGMPKECSKCKWNDFETINEGGWSAKPSEIFEGENSSLKKTFELATIFPLEKPFANSKNHALMTEFSNYCLAHPEMRFWQCLLQWSELPYIFTGGQDVRETKGLIDTYHWENKNN